MNTALQAIILLLITVALATAGGPDNPGPFKITTAKGEDSVEHRMEKGRTLFLVKSPSGIGRAVIERRGDAWPEAVTLRLHLRGLEGFKVSAGKHSLGVAVSAHQGKPEVRLWKGDKEDAPLEGKSPFRADVRVLRKDGTPAREVPLQDGHFEITLPRALFNDNPMSITLSWIDFYRN